MAGYENDDFADLEELKVLQLEGVDNKGRQIARIVGKFLPARVIDGDRLQAYMLRKLHQELQDGPIVILYFHTCVQSGDNSPGILRLRRIYESLPQPLKLRLEAVYIVHPGSILKLSTSTGLNFCVTLSRMGKLKYLNLYGSMTKSLNQDL
ncbi:hypothetical protein CY35_15G015400 [Sphagnum magellanicum]|nr:hypothetical protein CY35_15G015400 [Sphagnum magellanicum]